MSLFMTDTGKPTPLLVVTVVAIPLLTVTKSKDYTALNTFLQFVFATIVLLQLVMAIVNFFLHRRDKNERMYIPDKDALSTERLVEGLVQHKVGVFVFVTAVKYTGKAQVSRSPFCLAREKAVTNPPPPVLSDVLSFHPSSSLCPPRAAVSSAPPPIV